MTLTLSCTSFSSVNAGVPTLVNGGVKNQQALRFIGGIEMRAQIFIYKRTDMRW